MDVANVDIEKLRSHIHQVESHLNVLKQQLTIAEQSTSSNPANQHDLFTSQPNLSPIRPTTPISNGDLGMAFGCRRIQEVWQADDNARDWSKG